MRLGGLSDVAAELSVSRQRVSQLRRKGDFPQPMGEIAAGPVWDLDEIMRWNGSGTRRGPGRPPRSRQRLVLNDRFELEDMIGRGGFADVYRAVDRRGTAGSNAIVAMKLLRELDDKEVRARFQRELRIIRTLDHPNVVPVLDFGEDDAGQLWYAMPLAKASLAEELEEFVGNEAQILDVMRQICAGLEFVHGAGVYHRDLKPANILRMRSGTWAISDFGLAREKHRKTTALTSTLRTGFGTYFYAAPEVWKGAKHAMAPADIFALGKILQELITGDLPAPNADPGPHQLRPIIRKATRPGPSDRYQAVGAFLADLESLTAAPKGVWLATHEIVARLYDRMRDQRPDDEVLHELLDLALRAGNDPAALGDLREVIPLLSSEAIERLWSIDDEAFRKVFEHYTDYIALGSHTVGFVDDVSDFCDRAVEMTADQDILRHAVAALIRLASNQQRWRVVDVLLTMLQRIRTPDEAFAALDGLRKSTPKAIRWAFSDFAIRSLHPILRTGIEEILTDNAF